MKKGIVIPTIILLILIVVAIIGGLAIFVKLFFSEGGIGDKATDAFCSLSTSGKSITRVPGGHLFPELCKTRPKVITPNNWDECPHYKQMKEDYPFQFSNNREEYYNNCGAEQFAKLMVKCWRLMGEGEAERGSFECFSACVSSEKGMEQAHNEFVRTRKEFETAQERYLEAAEEVKGEDEDVKEFALSDHKDRLSSAQEEYLQAQKEVTDLQTGGVPTISITIGDIKYIMSTAIMEDEEIFYAEALSTSRIGEASYWDNVLTDVNLRKALWHKDLEGKITEGQVISIFFIDSITLGRFGFEVDLTQDNIKLRYKTSC